MDVNVKTGDPLRIRLLGCDVTGHGRSDTWSTWWVRCQKWVDVDETEVRLWKTMKDT